MLNVQLHMFQEAIKQVTAVIVLVNTNQMSQEMTEAEEMIEVQDIQEMTEAEEMIEIPEMVEIENKQL